MSAETSPVIHLAAGIDMPAIGLGTWPLTDDQVARTVVDAVEIGYRLVDTAAKYGNETGVGQGISDVTGPGGLDRSDLFVTTKLDGPYQGNDLAVGGLEASLRRLGLDYVDLLLIHWPLPDRDLYVDTWQTFATLLASGKTRAIGVSNFKPAHLDRLIAETGVTPSVNQIELNPTLARSAARDYNAAHGIVTQSWSPLGRGETLANPVITGIADRLGSHTGPGHPALAFPARTVRGAQIGDQGAAGREPGHLRLRADRPGHGRDHRTGSR